MLSNYLRLIRVSHWIKNSFLFVPIIFAELLFKSDLLVQVTLAALAFSLVSSLVYVFNDYIDIRADRLHPEKKKRPLASGAVSKQAAIYLMIILGACVVLLTINLPWQFNIVLLGYVVNNILYTLYLKRVVILDLVSITIGFLLRVLGGGLVIGVEVSSWLILTTLFISFYLGIMKRRSELSQLDSNKTRIVLRDYSLPFLDQIAAVTAACVIICYALYTVAERTVTHYQTENMVYTTIFVVFGIFRYKYLVYKKSKGENTVEILLTDIQLILNIVLYLLSITFIIYF